jgi:branched-chain amino acid transport system ATP-binding protein
MLKLSQVDAFYGDAQALWDVELEVSAGEVVTLLGSNGAGKSTVLRAISGLLPIRKGAILFNDIRLDQIDPFKIVGEGIAHVPEGRKVFPSMTVRDNLLAGAYHANFWAKRDETLEQVFHIFPQLSDRRNQMAGTLSGGEQQMLAIGRGLMSNPRLLMLDEPSLGLAPKIVEMIFEIIVSINKSGTTILLNEQNAHIALQVANRAYVMETGKITLSGAAAELASNAHIRSAYLGF